MIKGVKRIYGVFTIGTILVNPLSALNAGTIGDSTDPNWQGFYFGLNYAAGSGEVSNNVSTSVMNTNTTSNINTGAISLLSQINTNSSVSHASGYTNGSYANLMLGYNFQQNSTYVWGAQIEGNIFSDLTGQTFGESLANKTINNKIPATSFVQTITQAPYQQSTRATSLFTFLVRGGKLIKPNTLVYGLFGGTDANFYYLPSNGRQTVWHLGWMTGGGLEYKLTDHWSITGEYRFMRFNFTAKFKSTTTTRNTGSNSSSLSVSETNSTYIIPTQFNLNAGLVGITYKI